MACDQRWPQRLHFARSIDGDRTPKLHTLYKALLYRVQVHDLSRLVNLTRKDGTRFSGSKARNMLGLHQDSP